jgi:hypothetical protein
LRFDADAAVLAFSLTYEAEMARLPGDASELTRQAKHRELLGLDERETVEPSERPVVDVLALIGKPA